MRLVAEAAVKALQRRFHRVVQQTVYAGDQLDGLGYCGERQWGDCLGWGEINTCRSRECYLRRLEFCRKLEIYHGLRMQWDDPAEWRPGLAVHLRFE